MYLKDRHVWYVILSKAFIFIKQYSLLVHVKISFMNLQPIYSVSALNRETKQLLSQHFLRIRVEGEISNLSTPSSGHLYFTLKDEHAQIRCAMFRSSTRHMHFKPTNGIAIIVTAQVGLYEPRGDYQLTVEKIEPAGEGELLRAFEALKKRLQAEGLFAQELKKSLPNFPNCIGLITSPTGAAIRDILSVLKRRFIATPIIIYPTSVQGRPAKYALVNAIETANRREDCDLLIIARGGGSLEDLWPFNEEIVARAINQSQLPIVTGIGHETDFTIADFVADKRMATPSAAAEQVSPDSQELASKIQTLEKQIIKLTTNRLSLFNAQITGLNNRIQQADPRQQLSTQAQRLDDLEIRLNNTLASMFNELQNKLTLKTTQLLTNNPNFGIRTRKYQNQLLSNRLNHAIKEQLTTKKYLLSHCSQTLNSLSPLATLNRGYALITGVETGEVISSIKNLNTGDRINTRFSQGQVVSQIKEIKS